MTDNELLLAMSNIVRNEIEPVKKDVKDIRLSIEQDIMPRLQNIEACYTSTYRRYQSGINQIESLQMDSDILKKVVAEHSKKLSEAV